MPDPLEIRINSPNPNALEVPERFVADSEFAIELVNEGKPAHVHLNLDDDLADIIEMDAGNHFVPREDARRIPVSLRDARRPVRGKLKVSTGYGSESAFVELRVVEPSPEDRVTVDETLAEPQRDASEPVIPPGVLSEVGMITLVGVAIIALLLAAIIVGSVTSPIWGVLAVVIAIAVAGGIYYFL